MKIDDNSQHMKKQEKKTQVKVEKHLMAVAEKLI
jgi:hypothetical protein